MPWRGSERNEGTHHTHKRVSFSGGLGKDRLLFALPPNLERILQASNFCRNVHPVKLVSQTRKSPLQRETCKGSRSPVTGGLVSEK